MNYYERHIGDYLKDTAHLSLLQHGIYARLMDVYYTREGALPDADAMRLIGARSKDEKAAGAAVLSEFFTLVAGEWHQGRCDAEIARYKDKQDKARRSAEARWSECGRNANALRSGDAKRMRTHSEGNALQTPDSSLQTPVSIPKPNTSEADASGAAGAKPAKITDPDEIIFGYGVPLLVTAGTPEKQARSFLGKLRKQGDDKLIAALRDCIKAKPLQPLEWLAAAMPPDHQPLRGARRAGTVVDIEARDAEAKRLLGFEDDAQLNTSIGVAP